LNSSKPYLFEEKSPVKSSLKKLQKIWSVIGFEAVVWILGLFFLIFIHSPGERHFTICPLANLGFEFCPGCGLGNSISYIFRGDFIESFHSHPLGIFALIIITSRIISIINNNRRRYA
jgi:hypothetical protein